MDPLKIWYATSPESGHFLEVLARLALGGPKKRGGYPKCGPKIDPLQPQGSILAQKGQAKFKKGTFGGGRCFKRTQFYLEIGLFPQSYLVFEKVFL